MVGKRLIPINCGNELIRHYDKGLTPRANCGCANAGCDKWLIPTRSRLVKNDVLLRSPANPSCPAYCSQVWDFSWGHLANNVNIIMITRSRSFFYSVNLAVQKVKTRERTNTAINISQRWIIPVPQSTVLCRNTDLPSYYHSFVAVTGVNPSVSYLLLRWG